MPLIWVLINMFYVSYDIGLDYKLSIFLGIDLGSSAIFEDVSELKHYYRCIKNSSTHVLNIWALLRSEEFINDRSKAMLLLKFILIVNVHPLSVCLTYCSTYLG